MCENTKKMNGMKLSFFTLMSGMKILPWSGTTIPKGMTTPC